MWENGTDSEQLPVVDGTYVMSNIKRSSNGMYRCIAYNGVLMVFNIFFRVSKNAISFLESSFLTVQTC